jgi:Pyruvate/2-oxoacid:ferredoxin oxidoreductase delta subunit
MSDAVYRQLLEVMKKRGGPYAGADIPEFYEMAEALFTPEEARVNNAMPKGLFTAADLAGLMFNSGFEPRFDPDVCTACEACLDRCPSQSLSMGEGNVPVVDLDRCFGCAACATGSPVEAISMVKKPGFAEPPKDTQALKAAIKAAG